MTESISHDTEKLSPVARERHVCRAVLALPLLALVYLAVSGRRATYFRQFTSLPVFDQERFDYHMVTAVIWIIAILPLGYQSWNYARAIDGGWFAGFREVFRVATSRTEPPVRRASAHDQSHGHHSRPQPEVILRGLHGIRVKRRWLWCLFLSYLPAAGLAGLVIAPEATAFTALGWMVAMAVTATLVSRARCPRCGGFFHRSRLWYNTVAQRCMHCGLRLRATTEELQK
jgi:hypothetical protein